MRLKFQTELTLPQAKRVKNAVELVTKKGLSERLQRQQRFLSRVLDISPGYFLLCAIALSQNALTYTKDAILDSLLDMMRKNKENTAVTQPDILLFAAEFKIPGAGQLSRQSQTLSAESEQTVGTAPEIPTNGSNDSKSHTDDHVEPPIHTQHELVSANASLQGIANVFDKFLCDKIRKNTVGGKLKAAVTMVFPGWAGPVECVMSLDVCVRDAEQLAMALFNIKVEWVDQVLRVVVNEAVSLIVSNFEEAALKGAPDAAVLKVFGPEIHDAITQCPIRRRELVEGRHVTECVSMFFLKNGAIINLSLDLEGGLQIWNKLYT